MFIIITWYDINIILTLKKYNFLTSRMCVKLERVKPKE